MLELTCLFLTVERGNKKGQKTDDDDDDDDDDDGSQRGSQVKSSQANKSSQVVVGLRDRVAIFPGPASYNFLPPSQASLRGLRRSEWGRPLGGTSAWRPAVTVTGPSAGN